MFTLYLGGVGTGKTTLMKDHVRRSPAPDVSFLIIDHAGEWRDSGRPFASVAEFRDSPTVPRFSVFPSKLQLAVAQLCIDLGDAVYVDDECESAFDDTTWKENPLREILKRGRHLTNARGEVCEVGAMLASHRPANLPTDITALMRAVYIGRMTGYLDAERIYREGWVPEAESARDVARILRARGPGEFTLWRP